MLVQGIAGVMMLVSTHLKEPLCRAKEFIEGGAIGCVCHIRQRRMVQMGTGENLGSKVNSENSIFQYLLE